MPANFSLGWVVDTSRMFHAAVAASNFPARKPTRGTGVGSPADMLALPPPVVETADVHAAAEKRPSASASENSGAAVDRTAARRRYTDAIVDTSNVADWEPGIFVNGLIT
jgi:hypothetical protein